MKIIEWSITVLSILAATLMSFGIPHAFFLFTAVNILSIYFFNKKGMKGITIVNYFFLLTSLNGIYMFFIR